MIECASSLQGYDSKSGRSIEEYRRDPFLLAIDTACCQRDPALFLARRPVSPPSSCPALLCVSTLYASIPSLRRR